MVNFSFEYNYLMEITSIISSNVRRARERVGITQKVLAERCGVTTHQIGEIEAGRRKPSVDLLFSLGVALGIPSSDLLDSENKPPPVYYSPKKAIEKYLVIPDKIVELMQDLPEGDEVWGTIEDELEDAHERLRKAAGHKGA